MKCKLQGCQVNMLSATALLLMMITACKKEDNPAAHASLAVISTLAPTDITPISAECGGKITSGGESAWVRGICWNTAHDPTVNSFVNFNAVQGNGTYSFALTGLKPATTYYARAYLTNAAGTSYGNEVTFTTPTLSLGLNLLDGIVYYIDSTGQHGLVTAKADQGTFTWANGPFITTGATSYTDGYTNTGFILAELGNSGSYAALACYNYFLGYYGCCGNFWFLPSKDQLSLMYYQKDLVGGFANLRYWSSSESDSSHAWSQDFSNGQQDTSDKSSVYGVRAIRSF